MISIVLPAYNESETITDTVTDLISYMSSRDENFEIVIVQNGSHDNTSEISKGLSARYDQVKSFDLEVPDYGAALRKGFQESKGELVVNFDVDFYDTAFLEDAVALVRSETQERPEVVVGSKRAEGSNDERPILRRLATFVFSTLLKVLFRLKVSDTHGIKAFHRASVAPLEEQCLFTIDLFDTELIIRCERAGLRVVEIPVTVKESRPARSPIISRIPRTLAGLAKMKIIFIKEAIVRR